MILIYSSIVDQDIEPTHAISRASHQLFGCNGVTDVALEGSVPGAGQRPERRHPVIT
jgi:hypothetical protein